jgi:hypothetical protein
MDANPPTAADYAGVAANDAQRDIYVVATAIQFLIHGRDSKDVLKLLSSVRKPYGAEQLINWILEKK